MVGNSFKRFKFPFASVDKLVTTSESCSDLTERVLLKSGKSAILISIFLAAKMVSVLEGMTSRSEMLIVPLNEN